MKYSVQSEIINIQSDSNLLKVLVLSPKFVSSKSPGILWIHGGGYLTGFKEMAYFSRAYSLVENYGAVVISPGYRLSLKHPYPSALNDCYNTLLYMKKNYSFFNFNPNQIMIGGESAGGGLAIATTLLARDRNEVNIAYQMPLYPMISYKDTLTSKRNFHLPWNTLNNRLSWKIYLKNLTGEIPKYASPSRETDFSHLPPTYTFVGLKEPFYCETIDFALSLNQAGTPIQIDVYDTGIHAFDLLLPQLKVSKQAIQNFNNNFEYALSHYFAPN